MPTLIKGDTLSVLEFRAMDDGKPVDLSGATVQLTIKIGKNPAKLAAGTVQIVNATQGLCRYQWQPSDLDSAGTLRAQLTITSGGRSGKSLQRVLEVKEGLV